MKKLLLTVGEFLALAILMAIAAIAQTSQPTEEFVLWKMDNAAQQKRFDAFVELLDKRRKIVEEASRLGTDSKINFDDDVKRRMLGRAVELFEQHGKLMQSADMKAGIKEFGIEIDGVYFFYAGRVDIKLNAFRDAETKNSIVYYNPGRRKILGMKITEIELIDCFGDTINLSGSGTVSGTEAGEVDGFENGNTAPTLAHSAVTSRLKKLAVKIAFGPEPRDEKLKPTTPKR